MRVVRILLVASMLLPVPLASAAEGLPASDVPTVVMLRDFPADVRPDATFLGRTVVGMDPVLRFVVLDGRPDVVAAQASDNVLGMEEDVPVRVETPPILPDDPMLSEQYGPAQVRAPEAWALVPESVEASVCVVDTGVRHTHEDLAGARWLGGYDFVNRDDDPMDDNGHGTHVAGIAAATAANTRGIAGIVQAGIYGVKVLDASGAGYNSAVASGVRWCADAGADVITLSLGSPMPTAVLGAAVKHAWAKGALVVAAAGNDGPCAECILYPAAYEEVVAVTCTTQEQAACGFSNAGRQAELAAPGHGILSTWHEGDSAYRVLSGTSMSAPHVAGVAALVWSAAPHLTNAQVREILGDHAHDLGAPGRDAAFGHGLVDAAAAVQAALNGTRDPEAEPEPSPLPARPRADAGPDQRLSDGDGDGVVTVQLNASGSRAADGIAKYQWLYGKRVVATGETAEVNATKAGRYRLTLVVTSENGFVDADSVTIDVRSNLAPHARFQATCAGSVCTFDASRSTDVDGAIASYEWKFGEGTTASGVRVEHDFARQAWGSVTLLVKDDGGRVDASSRILILPGL